MAGTGVGKYSTTASSNETVQSTNFAEGMAPSDVNNAARETMANMRSMYNQIGEGFVEYGDGDGTYTVTRSDADTITITSSANLTSLYYAGRPIRILDGGGNTVTGAISSSSYSSPNLTVNLSGISLASGNPTKVELGPAIKVGGGRVILDDDEDSYLSASTDDQIDVVVSGTAQLEVKDGSIGPTTDSDVDLGTTAKRFKDAFVDTLTTTGNVTVGGNLTVTGTGLVEAAYPVGSIYMNINSTDPNTLLGFGSWSRFGEGKMLISQSSSDSDFDTGEETGGAKTVTLSASELPEHQHHVLRNEGSNTNGTGFFSNDTDAVAIGNTGIGGLGTTDTTNQQINADANVGRSSVNIGTTGQAHNNMPPYIVVYMWKRAS